MAIESFILLILMASIIMKANVFSVIYLMIIFKYIISRNKCNILVRMVVYMSACFIAQYFLYVLNLTHHTCPSPYPEQMDMYPKNKNPHDFSIKYALPLFFKNPVFRNLRLSYLLGIGIEKSQI
jgi:hypothetical protein